MPYTSDSRYLRWLPPILWGLVILVLSLMPGGPGNMLLFGIPHVDKVGHFGMYAVWTFLVYRTFSYNPNRPAKGWLVIAVLIGAVLGVILEFGQLCMHQGRSFELADMIANAFGAVVGAYAGMFFFAKRTV